MTKNNVETPTRQEKNIACTMTAPYGTLLIAKGGAVDHLNMRVDQLAAFLRLISGQGQQDFADLDNNDQNSLLWLAASMAQECRDLLPLMVESIAQVTA